jgi:hypothetical protein
LRTSLLEEKDIAILSLVVAGGGDGVKRILQPI